jgi:hypothetical protein
MALENTSFVNEINQIAQNGPTNVMFHWRADILANGQTLPAQKLLSRDRICNYVESYADETIVELVFGKGTYNHDVLPYKENLLITLYREPLGEVALSATDTSTQVITQQFRGVIIDPKSAVIEGNDPYAQDKDASDLTNLVYIKFQLLDLTIEQLRMRTTGMTLRNTTGAEAIRYILTTESAKVNIDSDQKVQGVDLYPPNNTQPQNHIVIPHGTRVTDVPEMIVQRAGGIYNAGFGFYLQAARWYIYPLYDIKRYDNSLKTLTLFNVPKNRLPGTERTFRTTANQVIALVTGDVKHMDNTEAQQLNQGNGVRFADATKIMDGFVTVKDNKAQVLRSKNNNEYLAESRDTGLNNVQLATNRITSNPFQELSKLARRAGSHLMCRWENSDPDLIFPGMPVKYMYIVDDQVVEAIGTVVFAHHFTGTDRPGFTTQRHVTSSVLTLFLNKKIDWSQVDVDA